MSLREEPLAVIDKNDNICDCFMKSEGRITWKNTKTRFWIILLVLISVVLLILEALLTQPFEPKNLINTTAVMPLFIALILYLLDKMATETDRRKLKEKKDRVFYSLYNELKDTHDELSKDKKEFSYNGKTAKFTNKYLHHNIYDGVNATGDILYADYTIQQQIQNIVEQIKLRNEYLKKADDIIIENVDDDLSDEKRKLVFRYYLIVQKYDSTSPSDIREIIEENSND